MPGLNQQIVTGARGPDHAPKTGEVVMPHEPQSQRQQIRQIQLREGQVQFQSVNRRLRIQLTSPKQVLDPQTGMLQSVPPLSLQFEDNSCVTDDPEVIHRAMGCKEAGAVKCEKHGSRCAVCCAERSCMLGHKDRTGRPFKPHPGYGIRQSFWDATEAIAADKKARKENLIAQLQQIKENSPPEELSDVLGALGVDSFPLPTKEATKEATK